VYFFKSDTKACLQTNMESLKYALAAGSTEIEARALSGLGDAEHSRGRYISAYNYFNQCINLAREHGLGRIIAANLSMRTIVFIWQNNLEAALDEYNEALELALKTQNLRAEMINQLSGGYYWTTVGELDKAEECLQRTQALSRRLGSRLLEGACLSYLGKVKFLKGDKAEALELAKASLELLREAESGMTFRGPAALGLLVLASDDQGLRNAALAEAESLLAAGSLGHNHFNFYEDAMEATLRARDWDEVDRYAQALEDYTLAEPLPRCDFFIAWGRALAAHGRGKRGTATMTEFQRLHDEARRIDLKLILPSLETALSSP
jgi:hypothetical protein